MRFTATDRATLARSCNEPDLLPELNLIRIALERSPLTHSLAAHRGRGPPSGTGERDEIQVPHQPVLDLLRRPLHQ